MGTVPISTLAASVQNRLEEPVGAPGLFWSLQFELYTALVEGLNDLLFLVGRPDFLVNQPFTLVPNSVWQQLPKGALLMTDVQGPFSPLWKVSLFSMDYEQASWGSSWESDCATVPKRWGPVGLGGLFFIHPAVNAPVTVTVNYIAYPTTDSWPYSGAETVPFHDEIFQYLEMYAAHYARIKECGAEFKESLTLFQAYLKGAQRLTQIEDKKDPLIFSRSMGGLVGANAIPKR